VAPALSGHVLMFKIMGLGKIIVIALNYFFWGPAVFFH
jgi:hypothetical protein